MLLISLVAGGAGIGIGVIVGWGRFQGIPSPGERSFCYSRSPRVSRRTQPVIQTCTSRCASRTESNETGMRDPSRRERNSEGIAAGKNHFARPLKPVDTAKGVMRRTVMVAAWAFRAGERRWTAQRAARCVAPEQSEGNSTSDLSKAFGIVLSLLGSICYRQWTITRDYAWRAL